MPPKKRDRVNPTPSCTLHYFFSTPKSASKPKTSNSSSRTSKSKHQDIIVIDSDSDDEIQFVEHVVESKRRRLSPRNELTTPVVSGPSLSINKGATSKATPNSKRRSLDTKENDALLDDGYPGPALQFGTSSLYPSATAEVKVEEPSKNDSTFDLPTFGCSTLRISPDPSASVYPHDVQTQPADFIDAAKATLEDWEDAVEGDNLEPMDDSFMGNGISDASILPTEAEEDEANVDTEMRLIEDLEEIPFSFEEGEDTKPSRVPDPPTAGTSTGGNAFSYIMSSFKENAAWKEASDAEKQTFRSSKANGGRRKAPFYKVLQGMPIAVDAFRYGAIPGVNAYFLTHAHSDHYTNLSSSWKHGPIYCSEGTGNLIMHMLSVPQKWVHSLPMDTPVEIPNTGGVTVTLIEANHCPGSCLFLFEGRQTVNAGDSAFQSHHVGSSRVFRYLHCGDFRASPQHVNHPAVKGKVIDHVYLDTTYLDPRYTFPAQPLVISACADLAKQLVLGVGPSDKPKSSLLSSWVSSVKGKEKAAPSRPLVVVGTYSIGKERIVKAIARAIGSKVYCDDRKAAILRCEADPELDALLTQDPLDASIHLVPLATISSDRLQIYMDRFKDSFDRIIGFRPTGWTYSPPKGTDQLPSVTSVVAKACQKTFTSNDLRLGPKSTNTIQVYPVPYSEHSSFSELTCFALSLNWTKMIATVNVGSEASRAKMSKWVSRWEAERKKHNQNYVVPHRHPEYW